MREEPGQRVLRLRRQHLAEMKRAVVGAAPEEACGLVLGVADRGWQVVAIENVLHSPGRFRLEGTAQVRAMVEAEQKGWQLVGVFHSHPAGPIHPSPTDLAEAAYPEAIYLIWAPGPSGGWECRAFELLGDWLGAGASRFVPARLVSEE
ncbi:MAG: M67 family metallopeptidase [Anaerolineales bacterium]|jgi:proteasome lid subunit RPN8/RPN11